MVTASQAVDRISKFSGIIPATVSRTARALREADTKLWPQGAAGIGMGAQVEAQHLANLIIGLVAADSIATSEKAVAIFGDMVPPAGRLYVQADQFGSIARLLFPDAKAADLPDYI